MTTELSWSNVPTYHQLFNPTIDAIRYLGGSGSNSEISHRVIDALEIPQLMAERLHGGGRQTELEYRLAWARTYLKQFGMIINSERGVWSLTATGSAIDHVEPREVVDFVLRQGRAGQGTSAEEAGLSDDPEQYVEESSSKTASWREELMDALLDMQPAAFERLCQRLLRESGFIEVQVTGRVGDGGIDGHGIIRLAGLIGFPVMFQCKRYADNVGSGAVRDFRGAMVGRADKGLIITTGGFTKNAYDEATREGAPPIDLIDGELLMDKLKELRLGVTVRTTTVEVVETDRSWIVSV